MIPDCDGRTVGRSDSQTESIMAKTALCIASYADALSKMILNITKTKEIVFRRPNPRLSLHPSPLPDIEQVKVAKLLSVVLSERVHFDDHVFAVLKVCSQRMYLLKLLRAQGLPVTTHPTEYCISGSNIK